jgi:hypothetical protein
LVYVLQGLRLLVIENTPAGLYCPRLKIAIQLQQVVHCSRFILTRLIQTIRAS